MRTQEIKDMGSALLQVRENQKAALAKKLAKASTATPKGKASVSLPKAPWDKKEEVEEMSSKEKMKKGLYNSKMDPVDKKELKGKHDDREDGDIDNDGDADSTDKYLHNRRKAISKNMKKEGYGSMVSPASKKAIDARVAANTAALKAKGKNEEADETTPCPKCDGSMENHEPDCPLSKESNGNDSKVATASPKSETKKMATEGTVYARILEKASHKDGAKAETWDDKYKGKGAKDMKADLTTSEIDDMEAKSHSDATKAGRTGPKAKARPNDNIKGDKSIINPPKEAK